MWKQFLEKEMNSTLNQISDDPRDIPFSIPAGHCWVVRDNEKALDAADR